MLHGGREKNNRTLEARLKKLPMKINFLGSTTTIFVQYLDISLL